MEISPPWFIESICSCHAHDKRKCCHDMRWYISIIINYFTEEWAMQITFTFIISSARPTLQLLASGLWRYGRAIEAYCINFHFYCMNAPQIKAITEGQWIGASVLVSFSPTIPSASELREIAAGCADDNNMHAFDGTARNSSAHFASPLNSCLWYGGHEDGFHLAPMSMLFTAEHLLILQLFCTLYRHFVW